MDDTKQNKGAKKTLKIPPLQLKHKHPPSTPEWSAVKDISDIDIQNYEKNRSAQNDRPHKKPWALVDSSDEDGDDLDFDIVIPKSTNIQKSLFDETTRADQNQAEPAKKKPAENGNGVSKSIKNTEKLNGKKLNADFSTGVLSSKEIGKIMKRRCSVQIHRVSADRDVDNNKSPGNPKTSKSYGTNNNNTDDHRKSSSRATKRPADDRDGPTQPKRKAKHVEPSVEHSSRRLRDRNVSTAESNKRKNTADSNQENDQQPTKEKRSRGKASQVESNEMKPMRRSARTKTRDEPIEVISASVSVIFHVYSYMMYVYINLAFLCFRLSHSNEHYDHEISNKKIEP